MQLSLFTKSSSLTGDFWGGCTGCSGLGFPFLNNNTAHGCVNAYSPTGTGNVIILCKLLIDGTTPGWGEAGPLHGSSYSPYAISPIVSAALGDSGGEVVLSIFLSVVLYLSTKCV
jgi:hypothetical protein